MNSKTRNYGILAGAGTVIYLLLFYFVNKSYFVNGLVTWSSLIIYLVFMYKAIIDERNERGGDIEFKDAVRPAFLVYVIANLIYYSFLYSMFNFFYPELVEIQREMMEKMGLETEGNNLNMTLSMTFFAFIQSLIAGFAFSAILAAILKR